MKRSLLLLIVLLTACRDAPEGFIGPNAFDSISPSEAGRLTWNPYEDHSPAWNATSDSIYYSARPYPGFPTSPSLLLSVPRTRGRAQLMLAGLQAALPTPALAAMAVSRNHESIAFVQLTELNTEPVCTERIQCNVPPLSGIDTTASNVPLVRGMLRVRSLNGGAEVTVPIVFEGVVAGTNNRIAHPFQRQYSRDRAEVFRPSWSPDGTRVVYSDGLQLRILDVSSGNTTVIPNTQDGVWPAWSPSGDVIAFTRLLRTGSHNIGCGCYTAGRPEPALTLSRTIYHDGNDRIGTLTLINPDGSNARTRGIGEAPAWSPDGNTLVFQRGSQLLRANADGMNAVAIPNTDFAYEPAISPDGRFLAFTRDPGQRDRINHIIPNDIWVVDF